jgi:hypothetical protein
MSINATARIARPPAMMRFLTLYEMSSIEIPCR